MARAAAGRARLPVGLRRGHARRPGATSHRAPGDGGRAPCGRPRAPAGAVVIAASRSFIGALPTVARATWTVGDRPDRLLRATYEANRWAGTMASGFAISARRFPDAIALKD